jgi:antitoxin component YwqK of YwqJK toxin-antitoxin module
MRAVTETLLPRAAILCCAIAGWHCSGRTSVERNTKSPTPVADVVHIATVTPDAAPPPAKPRLSCAEPLHAVATWEHQVGATVAAFYCTDASGIRNGDFIVLYPNGATAIVGAMSNDELHGHWQRLAPSGVVVEAGDYSHGHKDGDWQQWSRDGKLLGSYAMNLGTGTENMWNDDGWLWRQRAMTDGISNGVSSLLSPLGLEVLHETFKNGLLDGPRFAGDKMLLRMEEKWRDGARVGERKLYRRGLIWQQDGFDSKGRRHGGFSFWRDKKTKRDVGAYAHGHRVGPWKWFDSSGNVERLGAYLDGRRDGAWSEMYENKITWTGQYKNGRADGTFSYFDYRGNEIGSFDMKDGTGTMLTFTAAKKIDSKVDYKDGRREGLYQELTAQAKVLVEGHYRNGKRHGTWIEKTATGAVVLSCEFAKDKLVAEYRRYSSGNVQVKATYGTGKQAGERNGEYLEYADNTVVIRGHYSDDQKDGVWQQFDRDGKLTVAATWSEGELNGSWQEFNNGKLSVTGLYAAGVRAGTWQWLDGNGTVLREAIYKAP